MNYWISPYFPNVVIWEMFTNGFSNEYSAETKGGFRRAFASDREV